MLTPTRDPTLGQALIPVVFLMAMLATSVMLFGDESSSGPNQIALILGTAVALLVALRNGHNWQSLETGISRGVSTSIGAILYSANCWLCHWHMDSRGHCSVDDLLRTPYTDSVGVLCSVLRHLCCCLTCHRQFMDNRRDPRNCSNWSGHSPRPPPRDFRLEPSSRVLISATRCPPCQTQPI